MKINKLLASVASAIALASGPAAADLALMLTAGAPLPYPGAVVGPSVTIYDQVTLIPPGPGDTPDINPALGAVTFVGPLGAWNINITTGLGSLALGGPSLDLSSVNVSTIGGGAPGVPVAGVGTSLEIKLSETDLDLGAALQLLSFLGGIGGTADARITYEMWVDDANNIFGLSQLIGMGTFTGAGNDAPFADTFNSMRMVADNFSMTLRVVIEHGDGISNTSFNFSGAALRVPEPGTLLILGAGLVLLAFVRRPRRG